ncbi:MAG: ABC transporter ATP-binding protein, partial [Planctomycetes bacterium]|nr:ABC transporter ATP-binding protein [Planctomycetota bacterium]
MKSQALFHMIYPYRRLALLTSLTLIIFCSLGLLFPLAMKFILDDILPSRDTSMLFVLLLGLAVLYAVRAVFFYISHYILLYVSNRVLFDIRKQLFVHVQRLSLSFHDRYRSGKLIASMLNDVGKIKQMVDSGLGTMVTNTFCALSVLVILIIINPVLSMICMLVLPIYGFNFLYFKIRLHRENKLLQHKVSEVSANLSEVLSGTRVVKAFGRERSESSKFVSQIRELFDLNIDIGIRNVLCWIFADCLFALSCIAILGAGAWQVWSGSMSLGAFVSFYAYVGMLFNPVIQLTQLAPVFGEGVAGLSRVMSIMSVVPAVQDGHMELPREKCKGCIEFRNVDFSYRDKLILSNFNLFIPPGKTVALVGPSGSGKSTIANLLMRFYDIDGGALIVDGHELSSLKMSSWRKNVGVVLQDPFLFSGTIASNIAYGKTGATREEIVAAARVANAHEFIEELEKGYDTPVGERGVMLSGGQKQRIAIARTVLQNPPI